MVQVLGGVRVCGCDGSHTRKDLTSPTNRDTLVISRARTDRRETTMGYNYPLLSQVLRGNRRQITDRQNNASEIRRTAKFHECGICGETWSLDEGDTCDWCEPSE